MKLNNQQKTNFIFYGIITVLLAVVVLLVILFINIFPIFSLAITGHGEMTCDCSHHVVFLSSHPYIGGFVIFLVVSMLLFVIYTLFQILKNIIVTRHYINKVLKNKTKLSSKVKDISQSIGLEDKIIQVKSEMPEVFCFGFIKPKVCISSKLVKQVSKNQLRAILLHEKNHIKSYDPLRLCIVNTLRKSLFFIPGMKKFIDYFIVNLELSADERATNNFKEIKSLGSALLKISDLHKGHKKINTSNVSVSFLSVTEERIDRLIDKSFTITFKVSFIKFVTGAFVFVALFVVVFNSQVWLVEASQMDEMNSDLTCSMEQISIQDTIVSDVNIINNSACDHSSVSMSCLEEVNTTEDICF